MLKHLSIRNYALIKQLELDPSGNLNVITGETGAGKSILLGAMGLLMGNRADSKVLWDENEKCVTEGIFDIRGYKLKPIFRTEDLDYDDQTVIRREISPGGKSRAFINDTPVTLDVMRKIGGYLMDIHSQHETLQLGNQVFQLHLLDTFAENSKLGGEYEVQWSEYLELKRQFEKLSSEAETLRQEADYTNFQLDELSKAALEENEQESLESELQIMEHAEEIKTRFNTILELLSRSGEYASRRSLADARNSLQHLAGYSAAYDSLHQRLNSMLIELDDILNEIDNEESKIEFDPARSEFIKERLNTIYRLQKKHRVITLKELLVIQQELDQRSKLTSNLDGEIEKARLAYAQAENKLHQLAAKLSETRKKVINPLSKKITALLDDLGIPNARLQIDIQATSPTPTGIDKVDILFSANKGIPPRPLSQVASGGEFSRLMFCIKYVMAEKSAMPTLVLDEIDTGISGEIAMKLGTLMQRMAERHQLITITHLPQIAGKGDTHYYVYKDNSSKKTVSSIRALSKDERIEEIAKMIGGAKPSKIALENAQELLTR
jgi:DNA repair protein RecN (Recombination protein N)